MSNPHEHAHRLIDQFAARKHPQAFTRLHRARIASGLRIRVDKPHRINQGNVGLCVPASIVYRLAKQRPVDYVLLVTDLFENGRAWLNKWELKPCADLKRHAIAAEDNSMPETDWIPLASIRDCEPWVYHHMEHHYTSKADHDGFTVAETIAVLKKAGYKQILHQCTFGKHADVHNLRGAGDLFDKNYTVFLRIDAGLLDHPLAVPKGTANHRVALVSPPGGGHPIFLQGDTVHLTVHTWGRIRGIPHPHGHRLKLNAFLEYYYGYIACKS
jgi:hypothetical protein